MSTYPVIIITSFPNFNPKLPPAHSVVLGHFAEVLNSISFSPDIFLLWIFLYDLCTLLTRNPELLALWPSSCHSEPCPALMAKLCSAGSPSRCLSLLFSLPHYGFHEPSSSINFFLCDLLPVLRLLLRILSPLNCPRCHWPDSSQSSSGYFFDSRFK